MTPEPVASQPNFIVQSLVTKEQNVRTFQYIYCRSFPPGASSNSLRNLLEVSCDPFYSIIQTEESPGVLCSGRPHTLLHLCRFLAIGDAGNTNLLLHQAIQTTLLNTIEGASGDAILWCHGNLYFYFPPLYFCLFYIPLLTQLYSFTSSTIQFLYATHAKDLYLQPL